VTEVNTGDAPLNGLEEEVLCAVLGLAAEGRAVEVPLSPTPCLVPPGDSVIPTGSVRAGRPDKRRWRSCNTAAFFAFNVPSIDKARLQTSTDHPLPQLWRLALHSTALAPTPSQQHAHTPPGHTQHSHMRAHARTHAHTYARTHVRTRAPAGAHTFCRRHVAWPRQDSRRYDRDGYCLVASAHVS